MAGSHLPSPFRPLLSSLPFPLFPAGESLSFPGRVCSHNRISFIAVLYEIRWQHLNYFPNVDF